jgi:hypothetical protein
MGDTICGMRTLAIAVAIAACSSDPTLHVTVVHTTDVKVSSTTISVYDSKMFTCQDIEYGNVDASALDAALVAEETIDSTGSTGSLSNLPRTDDKVIVARGYNDALQLVAAGCADKGVVSGSDKVEVDTVATAVVSLSLADPTGTDLYGIATTLTDVDGKAIDNRQVWWRVYGPGGFAPASATSLTVVESNYWEPTQPTCSDKKGSVTIHPVPPALLGGFSIKVRAAWAVDPPQQFTSFTKLPDLSQPATLGASSGSVLEIAVPTTVGAHQCARRVSSAGPSLVCIDGNATKATDITVSYDDASGAILLTKGASASLTSSTPIGVYGVDAGGMRDAFVANADCTTQNPFGTGSRTTPTCTGAGLGAGADEIMYVPACGTSPALLLFHIPRAAAGTFGTVLAFDPNSPTSPAATLTLDYRNNETDVALNSAGCVTELDPTGGMPVLRQVIVLDYGTPIVAGMTSTVAASATRAHYGCPACTALGLPVAAGATGFLASSTESRMIIPIADATGVELAQVVLIGGGMGPDRFVERAKYAAASVPDQIISGTFDRDTEPDLLWNFSTKRGTLFEVSYARLVDDQRLTALSGAVGLPVNDLIVGDVTGDHNDDVAVVAKLGGVRFVGAVPLQVPPPAADLMADTPCDP